MDDDPFSPNTNSVSSSNTYVSKTKVIQNESVSTLNPNVRKKNITDEDETVSGILKKSFIAFTLLLISWGYVHHLTLQNFYSLYTESIYNYHSIFVFPLFCFMIFLRRKTIQYKLFTTSKYGILSILLLNIIWGYSNIFGNVLGQQMAVVAMLPAIIYATIGYKGCRAIAFPLLFLLFAIPLGSKFASNLPEIFETLITNTWNIIANINLPLKFQIIKTDSETIQLQNLINILKWTPLISMLGGIFSFFACKKLWKQIVITLLFALLPIYSTIFILGIILSFKQWYQYISPSELSFYSLLSSWIGIFLAILFAILLKKIISFVKYKPTGDLTSNFVEFEWIIPIAFASGIFLSTPTLVVITKDIIYIHAKTLTNLKAPKIYNWLGPKSISKHDWNPSYPLAKSSFTVQYQSGSNNIQMFTAYFGRNIEAEQLTNPKNQLYSVKDWTVSNRTSLVFDIPTYTNFEINEIILTRGGFTKVIWYWYYIGGKNENKVTTTNILDMLRYITKAFDNGGIIAISTNVVENIETSRNNLKKFLFSLSPYLDDITDPRVIK